MRSFPLFLLLIAIISVCVTSFLNDAESYTNVNLEVQKNKDCSPHYFVGSESYCLLLFIEKQDGW